MAAVDRGDLLQAPGGRRPGRQLSQGVGSVVHAVGRCPASELHTSLLALRPGVQIGGDSQRALLSLSGFLKTGRHPPNPDFWEVKATQRLGHPWASIPHVITLVWG